MTAHQRCAWTNYRTAQRANSKTRQLFAGRRTTFQAGQVVQIREPGTKVSAGLIDGADLQRLHDDQTAHRLAAGYHKPAMIDVPRAALRSELDDD